MRPSSSKIIGDHRSTGESWSNTSPNNDGGGGGIGGVGGEKNHHTPSPYRRRTVILPDCTDSHGGVLDVVHCCRVGGGGGVGIGGGGAHPSDNWKDNNESNVAGYHLRHISQGYDDDDNDGHTTLPGHRDRGSAPLLLPLLPLLSFGGTVPLICAHP